MTCKKKIIYLHIYDRNDALGLVKMPGNPVDRLRDKVQHQVEIHFIFLFSARHREKSCLKYAWFNTSLQAPLAVLGTQSFHSVDAKQYLLAFYSQTQNLVSSNYLLQYYTMTMNVSIFAKKWTASLFFGLGYSFSHCIWLISSLYAYTISCFTVISSNNSAVR